ncbi:hypothetical protein MUG78_16700 [Gordonia alkaliphila]|uniref:hypothetical protein n=1 Tax=Gordonia alkaliphila TaxID=1053547 RepID=UPI001FF3A6F0|nr:hypothetical protein [Gordonia alkaliphila]MCK0441042.1 hypothetical protein [Gordonia alkaliphila]
MEAGGVYRLRPSWRPRFAPDTFVPADLQTLTGPTTGHFDPPVELHWQPGLLDFADPADIRRFYSGALTKATRIDEFTTWINHHDLTRQWPALALPHRVRAAWETLHPHLRGDRRPVNARTLIQDAVLTAIADLGFALAGGSALIDYDVVDRDTEDIDAFYNHLDAAAFTAAAAAVTAACHTHGWTAELVHDQDLDKQMRVTVPSGDTVVVQMVYHQRSTPPEARPGGGLRLIFDDVVAGKAVALADSARGRDFHDLAMILDTAGWTLARVEDSMRGLGYPDMIGALHERLHQFRTGAFDTEITAAGLDPEFCHRIIG